MPRAHVSLTLVSLLVGSLAATPGLVGGAVLCARKSGVVVVRDACRKKETPVEQLGVSLQGPPGQQGPPGPQGLPGADGAPGTSLFAGTIPFQTTVTGVWSVPGGDGNASQSFPIPAPLAPTDAEVNFAPDSSTVTNDDDPLCTGSFDAPTAPPGRVCLYVSAIGPGISVLSGYSLGRHGFYIYGIRNSPSNTASRGSWAYTAP